MSVLRVEPHDVFPLRREVLRANQPLSACEYPGDRGSATAHFGAFSRAALIGVASIYREAPEGELDPDAWRLRGMATLDRVRGSGRGAALLGACIEHVEKSHGTRLWCNARKAAVGFYSRFGFQTIGGEFELPDIGPHYFMVLPLKVDAVE